LEALVVGEGKLGARLPYLGIGILGVENGPFGEYSLAIHTAAGWHTRSLYRTSMAVSGAWTGNESIVSLEYKEVIEGGPTEVALMYTYSGAFGGSIAPKDHEEISGNCSANAHSHAVSSPVASDCGNRVSALS
jgi:hypothetical protein